MKRTHFIPSLVLAAMTTLTACTGGVRVETSATSPSPSKDLSESGTITRGKTTDWRPPLEIKEAQNFDAEMFADLKANFVLPLELSPYRFAIESMTLSPDADAPGEWELEVKLDNGTQVCVSDFVDWDPGRKSNFQRSLRRTLAGLNEARSKDPALDRYIRHWRRK